MEVSQLGAWAALLAPQLHAAYFRELTQRLGEFIKERGNKERNRQGQRREERPESEEPLGFINAPKGFCKSPSAGGEETHGILPSGACMVISRERHISGARC